MAKSIEQRVQELSAKLDDAFGPLAANVRGNHVFSGTVRVDAFPEERLQGGARSFALVGPRTFGHRGDILLLEHLHSHRDQ